MLKHLAQFAGITAVRGNWILSARTALPVAKFASSSDEEVDPGHEETKNSTAKFRTWVDGMLESEGNAVGAKESDRQSQGNVDASSYEIAGERKASASIMEYSEDRSNAAIPQTGAQEPSTSSPGGNPRRYTVLEKTMEALPDVVVGYRELGITDPADGALLNEGSGQLNSIRRFFPAQTYEPQDLVGKTKFRKNLSSKVLRKAGNSETMREADFRNLSFLNKFTSETGMIPPRRVTRLKKSVHTHLCKQIKIARQMALLPPEGKLVELQQEERRSRA